MNKQSNNNRINMNQLQNPSKPMTYQQIAEQQLDSTVGIEKLKKDVQYLILEIDSTRKLCIVAIILSIVSAIISISILIFGVTVYNKVSKEIPSSLSMSSISQYASEANSETQEVLKDAYGDKTEAMKSSKVVLDNEYVTIIASGLSDSNVMNAPIIYLSIINKTDRQYRLGIDTAVINDEKVASLYSAEIPASSTNDYSYDIARWEKIQEVVGITTTNEINTISVDMEFQDEANKGTSNDKSFDTGSIILYTKNN